jgi:hypothetical protein
MQPFGRAAIGLALLACLAAGTAACGSRSAPPSAPPPADTPTPATAVPEAEAPPDRAAAPPAVRPDTCLLGTAGGAPVELVGLTEPVRATNAPSPTNAGERLVFRQLYESPLRIDCEGTPGPGLAESWQLDAGGAWVLTLRDGVRFTDGTIVTAADVVAAWSMDATGNPGTEARRHLQSVTALDSRRVVVRLRDGASGPDVFAHHDFAVFRRADGAPWPLGTRALRPEPGVAPAGGSARSLLTLVHVSPASAAPPDPGSTPRQFRFLIAPGADPRDLLDAGVDVLVTRDTRALSYASSLAQFESVPLAWDRTHVLVSRTAGPVQPLSASQRNALAREAVRGEARGAEPPFWMDAATACPAAMPQARPNDAPKMRRVVYELGDETARDLAERIVALSGTRSADAAAALDGLLPRSHQSLQQAIGLTGAALASARSSGTDAGYVLAVARISANICDALDAVVRQLPWLDVRAAVALVDTRPHAVIRRGRSGIHHEGDGGVLLDAGRP